MDLCAGCRHSIDRARDVEFCTRCGTTVGPFGGTGDGCPACRATHVPTAGFTRVGEFSGGLADLVRMFKFRGGQHLDRCHGHLLGRAVTEVPWFDEVDVLTAVPTCWQHRLRRRFHAASALAPHVARRTGLPLLALLRRTKGGRHQVGLPKAARVENVRGKFKISRGVALAGTVVCLMDDVATTGATIGECARVLKRAGAQRVYAAVVAHAGGLKQTPSDV